MRSTIHVQKFCLAVPVLMVIVFHSSGWGQQLTNAEWAQSQGNEGRVQEVREQLVGEIKAKKAVIDQIREKIAETGLETVRGKGRNDIPGGGRHALEIVLMEREAELFGLQEKLSHLQEASGATDLVAANRERQINEMIALRESLGGSVVGSVLGDLDVDGASKEQLQADFQNELARLVQEGQRRKELRQPKLPHYLKVPANAEGPEKLPEKNLSEESRIAKVDAYRAVSQQLEQLAWQLEEVEAFEEADRLRQQAADLLRQSRDLIR